MKKNPICTILWQDASYSYDDKLPQNDPLPQLTTGFIVKTNSEFTFIATNVEYDQITGKIFPIDGLIIPEKAILEFKKIGNYHE